MNKDIKNGDAVLDDAPQVINADLRKFNKAQQQVDKAVAACSAIVVTNHEQCNEAISTLGLAKKVEKVIEDKRVELVKPFNEAVKKINGFAKDLTAKLGPAITAGKQKVITWQSEEEKRLKKERLDARTAQLLGLGYVEVTNGFRHPEMENSFVSAHNVENSEDKVWIYSMEITIVALKDARAQKLQSTQEQLEELQSFGSEEQKQSVQEEINNLQDQQYFENNAAPMPFGGSNGGSVKGITRRWTFSVTDPALVPAEYLMVDEKKIREAVASGVRTIPGVSIFQDKGLTIR